MRRLLIAHAAVSFSGLDNVLRASCECHILLTTLVLLTFKIPLQTADLESDHRKPLDTMLVVSFIIMVPLAFVVVVIRKFQQVNETLNRTDENPDDDMDDSLCESFARFQVGLADAVDHRMLDSYADRVIKGIANKHTSAGRRLWNNKMIVTHFDVHGMQGLLDELVVRMQLSKSEELAFHFTSKESALNILQGHGIRASQAGQLGGGVSVCVWSMLECGWDRFRPLRFRQQVAKALWGQNSDQLMPNGVCYDKLDCALVVRVPVTAKRDKSQCVPGRPAVYIISPSSLEEEPHAPAGTVFLSNTQIAACLILQPPSGEDGNSEGWLTPGECEHSGLWAVRSDTTGKYTMDKQTKGARSADSGILGQQANDRMPGGLAQLFTAKVVPPGKMESLVLQQHRYLERRDSNRSLWIEPVLRFTLSEMQAAISSLDSQLLHAYSLAFCFCRKAQAVDIINIGGIPADTGGDGSPFVRVTTKTPVELGWGRTRALSKNEAVGGHHFRCTAGQHFWDDWDATDPDRGLNRVEVMLVLRVPTSELALEEGLDGSNRAIISDKLLRKQGKSDSHQQLRAQTNRGQSDVNGDTTTSCHIYPSAHILKCYRVVEDKDIAIGTSLEVPKQAGEQREESLAGGTGSRSTPPRKRRLAPPLPPQSTVAERSDPRSGNQLPERPRPPPLPFVQLQAAMAFQQPRRQPPSLQSLQGSSRLP